MADEKFLYFAYGSNLPTLRMRSRCSSAEFAGVGKLENYSLAWNKTGKDGSAKCNLVPDEDKIVYGAVYRIDKKELKSLRRAEGCCANRPQDEVDDAPDKYHEKIFLSFISDMNNNSFGDGVLTYIANVKKPDGAAGEELKPYEWYRDLVVLGAQEHELPQDYIEGLEKVAAQPNSSDSKGEQKLVEEIRAQLDTAEAQAEKSEAQADKAEAESADSESDAAKDEGKSEAPDEAKKSGNNIIEIAGCQAAIIFDSGLNMLCGKFVTMPDCGEFYADNVQSLYEEGKTTLSVYLAECHKKGLQP